MNAFAPVFLFLIIDPGASAFCSDDIKTRMKLSEGVKTSHFREPPTEGKCRPLFAKVVKNVNPEIWGGKNTLSSMSTNSRSFFYTIDDYN